MSRFLIGDRVDRADEGLRQLAREFAGGHRRQQCVSLGISGAPSCNLTDIGRDLPANSRSFLMVITQETTPSGAASQFYASWYARPCRNASGAAVAGLVRGFER